MADIAAGDLTYTNYPERAELTGSSKLKNVFSVAFGDGTDTYPSGGIPLTKGSLGLPNVVESVNIIEPAAGDGFIYKYDDSAVTIRIYQADYDATADGALIELVAGTTAVTAATLILEVTGY